MWHRPLGVWRPLEIGAVALWGRAPSVYRNLQSTHVKLSLTINGCGGDEPAQECKARRGLRASPRGAKAVGATEIAKALKIGRASVYRVLAGQ
jgi:hypothetical protein